MRKLFISTLFLLTVSVGISAQPYQSVFGKTSTSWNILWHNLDLTTWSTFYVQYDTVLYNGYNYKVIQDDILLREDTGTGRVWGINISPSYNGPYLSELLVMDMTLQLGDTFNIKYSDLSYGSEDPDTLIIVDSVYYSQGLKHIRFMSPLSSGSIQSLPDPIIFIEGIGPNYTLLWMNNDYTTLIDPYLLCAYKDSIKSDYVSQRFNGECTPVIGGVEKINLHQIHLYPNPAAGYINIDGIPGFNTLYVITDILGQPMQQGSLMQNSNTINIENLPAGYYQVTLALPGSQAYSQKFIKAD